MKIIRGTKDLKGVIYQKQPQGGTGRLVCGKCKGVCIQIKKPDGSTIWSCQGCRAEYKVTSMTPVVKAGVIPRKTKGLVRVQAKPGAASPTPQHRPRGARRR